MPSQGEAYMSDVTDVSFFKTGVGVIEPTDRYTDQEVATEIAESQKPVEDPAVVCMDERHDIREPQPVREKVAGGNLNTFGKAAAAVKWSGFTEQALQDPDVLFAEAANHLVDSGETLGAHRHAHDLAELETEDEEVADNTKEPKKTGCGAIDNGSVIDNDAAEHAMDEEWIEMAQADLGDLFNMGHWTTARDGFADMATDEKWRKWNHGKIQDKVEDKNGVVEVLDANSDAFASDDHSAPQRHGHWGEAADVNHNKGYSNDRDNATIPFFQVDIDPMVRMASAAAASETEFSLLLHAEAMRQYATTYRLTKNMRILRTQNTTV
jgi:hypothetical protein